VAQLAQIEEHGEDDGQHEAANPVWVAGIERPPDRPTGALAPVQRTGMAGARRDALV
jgi:hypothetical protein